MPIKNDVEQGLANAGDKIAQVKDLVVKLLAGGLQRAGHGAESLGYAMDDKLAEDIVMLGFMDKCAELQVDPARLVALAKSAQVVNYGKQPAKVVGPVPKPLPVPVPNPKVTAEMNAVKSKAVGAKPGEDQDVANLRSVKPVKK